MKIISFSPLPNHGEVIEINEFVDMYEDGIVSRKSGKAYYSNSTLTTNLEVKWKDIKGKHCSPAFTHVLWIRSY